MIAKLALVMLGGSLGAACRYGAGLLAAKLWGANFPWGTLAVNLAGCLLIGMVFGLAERESWMTPNMRLLIATGFLGALTTFSTFAQETVNAANSGLWQIASLNFLANNVGGILLALAGLWLAKSI